MERGDKRAGGYVSEFQLGFFAFKRRARVSCSPTCPILYVGNEEKGRLGGKQNKRRDSGRRKSR